MQNEGYDPLHAITYGSIWQPPHPLSLCPVLPLSACTIVQLPYLLQQAQWGPLGKEHLFPFLRINLCGADGSTWIFISEIAGAVLHELGLRDCVQEEGLFSVATSDRSDLSLPRSNSPSSPLLTLPCSALHALFCPIPPPLPIYLNW